MFQVHTGMSFIGIYVYIYMCVYCLMCAQLLVSMRVLLFAGSCITYTPRMDACRQESTKIYEIFTNCMKCEICAGATREKEKYIAREKGREREREAGQTVSEGAG